ncbi:MAG: thiamine pyrophosphate-dependent dehydrogenase E1 component subunit alpha [Dethiobacter sp.]|nr:thiamine pyrophosphate-dependent dehydrogenase E1 component subunit alpha [Dethiobacter sp.]
MTLSNEELLEMYRLLLFARRNDEKICEIYASRGLPELHHSSLGEEAIAVGTTFKLRQDDYVLPSLRARGMFYTKGVSANLMMAGMFGKKTGPAGGKATSHHMGDLKLGVLPGTGLIGSSIPIATGAALGIKQMGKDSVVITTFGDGASSRGDFHESLNLASVWKLPIVFVCENNAYAIGTCQQKQMAIQNVADRAPGYGIPGVIVDGNDIIAVFEATQRAVARARAGEGPTLLECKTKRWRGHSENDKDLYRCAQETAAMRSDCPVKRFEAYLLEKGVLSEKMVSIMEMQVQKIIDESVKFAEESPFPAPEEALGDVFSL